jgi:hypothetical protein
MIARAYAWWEAIPAPVREPIKSACVSAGWTLQTAFWMLFGSASQDGHNTSPADFAGYAWTHGWGIFVGILLPTAYRARQGYSAAIAPPTPPPIKEG